MLDVSKAQLTGPLPAIWADSNAMAERSARIMANAIRRLGQSTALVSGDGDAAKSQSLAEGVASALTKLQQTAQAKPSFRLGTLKLRELRLASNKFTGQLPGKWSAFKQLQVCT